MAMAQSSTSTKPTSKDNETKKRKPPSSSSKNDNTSTTPSNKKRALKHQRQSHRKHYSEVTKAKDLWNKLRIRDNQKENVDEMMNELMNLLEGKMSEVATKHDASRVVQSAIQLGSTEQRLAILKEISPGIAELSKMQYAHFVVLKLIKYCARDDDCRRLIVKALKGHISSLAIHAVGARVVELLFATFPPKSTTILRQELYGPQFALFPSGDLSNTSSSLRELTQNHPLQRSAALRRVLSLLQKGILKGLFHFAYFQELCRDYIQAATPNEIRNDIASSLVDHSIHMLSTRAGAKVIAECAAYGTVKDRKRIMKSLKGYTRSSLLHRDAYLAILRIVDVTDDTVSVQKLLLAELLVDPSSSSSKKQPTANDAEEEAEETEEKDSPILDLALSDTASKLFLHLLSSSNDTTASHYFDPFELELLREATIEENNQVVPTSKKNPETRKRELGLYLRTTLCDLCLRHTEQLMRSNSGSKVLYEVYRSFGSHELVTAVVEACDETIELKKSIFEDSIGHLFVKHMLLAERCSPNDTEKTSASKKRCDAAKVAAEAGISFASELYAKFKGRLMEDIATSNRGAFVLAALAAVDSIKEDVKNELEQHIDDIKTKSKEMKGFEALLHAMNETTPK